MRRGARRLLLCSGALLAAWLLLPRVVLAHEGQPLMPHDLWQTWNWEPLTLATLLATALGYGAGVRALWRAAGAGRGLQPWRVLAFAGGLLALFVALVSPLEALAGALFSAHMAQHLLLILIAPPLLLAGRPDVTLTWALPAQWRQGLVHWQKRRMGLRASWRFVSKPVVVWLLYALGFWIWHAPFLYEAALRYELMHVLEHMTFLGTALLFWWTLAHCRLRGAKLSHGLGILFVFTTALHGGLMGWLLTFTTQRWYPAYGISARQWGMTPLADQQLAGAIMWAPAGIVYALAALVLLGAWLERLERQGRPGAPDKANGRADVRVARTR